MKVEHISLALNYHKCHKYCPPAMVRLRSSVGLRHSNRVSAPGDRTDVSRGIKCIGDTTLFFVVVVSTNPLFLHLSCSKCFILQHQYGNCSLLLLALVFAVQSCRSHLFTNWLHSARGEARVWLLCGHKHDHLHGILLLLGMSVWEPLTSACQLQNSRREMF